MLLLGVARELVALSGELSLAVVSPMPSGALVVGPFVAALAVGLSLTGDPGSILELAASLVIGAVILGAIGWVSVSVLAPEMDPVLGVMAGIAVGGGFGVVIRLLTVPEAEDTGESVTIDTSGEGKRTSEPRPADLFEASPDPMVYYTARSDPAIALAVNPAFREAFGPDEGAVEGTPLADLLDVAASGPVVDAIEEAAHHEERVEMETSEGTRTFRVRVIPGGEGSASGYVTMTAAAGGE